MTYNFSFKCRQCGECCREEGYIFFTKKDIKRASDYLKMEAGKFKDKYLKTVQGEYAIKVSPGKPCVFLNSQGACAINSAKPQQCSSFPYWPEYVNDAGELINFDRPCPGVKLKEPV